MWANVVFKWDVELLEKVIRMFKWPKMLFLWAASQGAAFGAWRIVELCLPCCLPIPPHMWVNIGRVVSRGDAMIVGCLCNLVATNSLPMLKDGHVGCYIWQPYTMIWSWSRSY